MAFVPPHDRVSETSTSNSQTIFALAGAVDTSFNRFSASMSVGDTTVGGAVEDGVAFKTGKLTYSNTNEITIDSSSYGGESKGTFSSGGSKTVFMGLPAARALMFDGAQTFTQAQKQQALTNLGGIYLDAAQSLTEAQKNQLLANIGAFPQNFLAGLGLANNVSDATNDIDIAVGEAADNTNVSLMRLASALTKRLDASWAMGTNQGGLDTGSIANTTYHVWLIQRSDTGVVDALFSASASSPTMPTNYDRKRRIGSIIRASATILAFTQNGNKFELTVGVQDINSQNIGTTATDLTLASVPIGVSLTAIGNAWVSITGAVSIANFYPKYVTDQTVTFGTFGNIRDTSAGNGAGTELQIQTDTSSKIRARGSAANATVSWYTKGWVDTRGQ